MASASLVCSQTLQTLSNFPTKSYPNALTLGNDGNFYGTTYFGGITNSHYLNGMGTVFQLRPNGMLTTLALFSGGNGVYPDSTLTLGTDGNFYGATEFGGTTGCGTFFRVTRTGTLTSMYSFAQGNFPNGLTLGLDGNFYGTSCNGGIYGQGSVIQLTTNGTLTTLYSFNGTNDGGQPLAELTVGYDGNLYGTTANTAFEVTTNGRLTTLVFFGTNNGVFPSALTMGNDGNFYGTSDEELGDGGLIFQLTTNGTLTILATFLDAWWPSVPLALGNDGNFYGTTYNGGNFGAGIIFAVTTNGALTTVASFNYTDGEYPNAPLALGNDGNFYGTTQQGGANGGGIVFELSLASSITVQPQSMTNCAGSTATFISTAVSPESFTYQWLKNGTNLMDGGNISGSTTSTLSIGNVSDVDAAVYRVVVSDAYNSVTSSNATLTVIDPPSISSQPTNLMLLAGSTATFGVSLTGSAPCFQWLFNRANLFNATNSTLLIQSVETNNAGDYSLVLSNLAGSVTSSNAALTVVLSPTSRTNYASSTATFTVTALSPESLTYQWQKNGTNLANGGNISGATNSTLSIASLSDADAANYCAMVRDAYNGVMTSKATLTVNDSLVFVTQPLSQTLGAGSGVTFAASVYGAPPFVFQWYFNRAPVGSPSSGTNCSSFTLSNVGTNKSGNYAVEFFNGSGSLTSSNALLTVIPQPALSLQILADYPLLSLSGTLGKNFLVQYKTDLASTNWLNLLLVSNLPTTPYQFLDPSGVGQPERFYRGFFMQ